MDGVFMKKHGKLLIVAAAIWFAIFMLTVAADKAMLRTKIIRLHVVGNSNSEADQHVKLAVRDGVLAYLKDLIPSSVSAEEASQLLKENLLQIQSVADAVLLEAGFEERATVSFGEENFPQRQYETFSLPAGVYESLRISIGEAEGRNWWCVVFPSLCIPATTDTFEAAAVSSGFSPQLSGALSREEGYEIRFFLLDCLGMLENFFTGG